MFNNQIVALCGEIMRIVARGFFAAVMVTLLFANHSFAARENSDCLECHSEQSITKQGGKRLYIDPRRFSETSHKFIGCASCHVSVTDTHPADGVKPSHPVCRECHSDIAQEYAHSLHGKNATCADCHNPHQARKSVSVSGAEMNAICSRCHTLPATVKNHEKWLPQAGLHLNYLPCITCHTGSKEYYINLFMDKEDSKGGFHLSTYDELAQQTSDKGVSSLVDTNGDDYISLQELRNFNKQARSSGMRLRGMMMPEVMTHSFQILDNRRDCTFCHSSGTHIMQTSFVSFPTKSGAFDRLPVEPGAVLHVLYGAPDFYMAGGTRSKPLSIIGAIIIACGLIMPVGHGFMRFLTRKNRENEDRKTGKEVIVCLEPLLIRIWHWIHALSVVTLCLTGIQIRFSDVVNLFGSYKAAIYLHNTAGIMVAVSMAFWMIYYVVISHSIIKIYFLNSENIKHGLVRQVFFYFFTYFLGKPNPFHVTPENKFNALQKLAYLVIMFVFMTLVIVTGLLMLDIQPMSSMLFLLGGIKLIDGIHFLSACCLCAFVFTHFYLTTLGPTPFSEIRTMWTGWEKEEVPDGAMPSTTKHVSSRKNKRG